MDSQTSLFDRWISRPRRPWPTACVATLLLAAPFLAAAMDHSLATFFRSDSWWLLLYPTVVVYILPRAAAGGHGPNGSCLISSDPADHGGGGRTAAGSRRRAAPCRGVGQLLVGAVLSALTVWATDCGVPNGWRQTCTAAEAVLMYAMLAWVVYVSVVGSRLMRVVHRQPLRVDPLDVTPFEAIGRQALLAALVFGGGIALSILFMGIRSQKLRLVGFWLSYVPPLLVPVGIFFLSILPTHRVLSGPKARELEKVERQIVASCRALAERIEAGQDTPAVSQQILALSTYQKRLAQARTWPYSPPMLRTLFFSVLVPAATFGARVLGDTFFP